MQVKKNDKGFTMVEMILALVCMSALMVFTISALSPWVKSYTVIQQRYKTFENFRFGMSRMVKELQAISPGSLGPVLAQSSIDYTDDAGNPTQFSVVDNQMRRGSDPLFDDVTSLQFTYFDANSVSLATPVADPSLVRRVEVSIVVDPAGDTPATKLAGAAFLKGFLYAGFRQ